jgi:hypothetical protein
VYLPNRIAGWNKPLHTTRPPTSPSATFKVSPLCTVLSHRTSPPLGGLRGGTSSKRMDPVRILTRRTLADVDPPLRRLGHPRPAGAKAPHLAGSVGAHLVLVVPLERLHIIHRDRSAAILEPLIDIIKPREAVGVHPRPKRKGLLPARTRPRYPRPTQRAPCRRTRLAPLPTSQPGFHSHTCPTPNPRDDCFPKKTSPTPNPQYPISNWTLANSDRTPCRTQILTDVTESQ